MISQLDATSEHENLVNSTAQRIQFVGNVSQLSLASINGRTAGMPRMRPSSSATEFLLSTLWRVVSAFWRVQFKRSGSAFALMHHCTADLQTRC